MYVCMHASCMYVCMYVCMYFYLSYVRTQFTKHNTHTHKIISPLSRYIHVKKDWRTCSKTSISYACTVAPVYHWSNLWPLVFINIYMIVAHFWPLLCSTLLNHTWVVQGVFTHGGSLYKVCTHYSTVATSAHFFARDWLDRSWASWQLQCTGCGSACGNFTSASGKISDGSGSADYASNANCEWIIAPTGGGTIVMSFVVKTQKDADIVRVMQCASFDCTSTQQLALLSGTYSGPQAIQGSGIIKVTFTSDASVQQDGFEASWNIVRLAHSV